jgi:eukaryotic-like serine/threonine-protein kinase
MSIPEGTKLSHYQIRSLLGAGGMGEVYLAEDLNLHRRVALKLLRSDITDKDRLARFEREAYAASSLNHPNILTIFEIGQEGESQFIATEFIDGESLKQLLKDSTPPLIEILEIGIQIASALAAAHAAGIIHRDIKPDNIMLRRDHFVKVVDFGIAKLSEQPDTDTTTEAINLTAPGTVIGTAPYMSPEQVRGVPVDARTDIWSLGVVLYQTVAGRLPFAARSRGEVIAEILKTEPPALSTLAGGVPDELDRIVTRALSKDVDERYQLMADLGHDLKTLKKRLEFEGELQRSSSSRFAADQGTTPLPSAEAIDAHATQVGGASTADARPDLVTASSIEYLVGEIKRNKRGFVISLILFILVLGGGTWWILNSTRSSPPTAAAEIIPFTSFGGSESLPSFSPDGNRIAFTWNGERGDNTDIYIKQVGTEDLQRLTTDPAPEFSPRWSPNGLYVAFLRQTANDYGLYIVPSIGGRERQLTSLALVPPMRFDVVQVSWSPDSQWLAISDKASTSDPYSIFMLSVDSGEKRRVTTPPPSVSGDLTPAVSPDGKSVAYKHFESGGVSEIYVAPIAGGSDRRLTTSDLAKSSPAWTPDGSEVLFLSENGSNIGLWRVAAAVGTPTRIEAVGQAVTSFAISPQGNRLAWTQAVNDSNVWQADLSGGSLPVAQKASSKALISSTKLDMSSQFSPDGKRIVFSSTRSGRSSVWVADSNGEQQLQVVAFERGSAGSPRWSPDGKLIVFDGRVDGNADVYVVNVDGGKPRRMTTEDSEDVVPSFSRDGQWIYFCSNRSGTRQIWKMASAGGPAVQVTTLGGFDNIESPDGKFLYYAKGRGEPGIWRIPVGGGEGTPVLDEHRAGFWRQWAVTEQGIFFITAETPNRPVIEFFNFASRKISPVLTLDKPLPDTISGLAVSPDGRRLIWTQLDQVSSDITLMQNFR